MAAAAPGSANEQVRDLPFRAVVQLVAPTGATFGFSHTPGWSPGSCDGAPTSCSVIANGGEMWRARSPRIGTRRTGPAIKVQSRH